MVSCWLFLDYMYSMLLSIDERGIESVAGKTGEYIT
jgi:hypothetical protein